MDQSPAALLLLQSWELDDHGKSGQPSRAIIEKFREKTLQSENISKIHSTILAFNATEDQLEDAQSVGATLIPATKWSEWNDPQVDPPGPHWLLHHDRYYPQLRQLTNICHVAGYNSIMNKAADMIHQSLFPKARLHYLQPPQPLPGALFVGDSWDENDCGLTGFHRTVVQEFCARKGNAIRAYATIADVEINQKQREDAEKCGVTLIPATRKEGVEAEEDQPCLQWLLNHESYFPELHKLENIKHVVGYAPKTGRAAIDIKKKRFRNAELVLINHAYDHEKCLWDVNREKFRDNMLKMAGEADLIFSIGPRMHKHFRNQYRASINGKELADIPHSEIFPKPREAFFERQPVLPKSSVDTHYILTYGQINTLEALKSCENLAVSIGTVVNTRSENNTNPPEWSILGIPNQIDKNEVKNRLVDKMQSDHCQLRCSTVYSAKTLKTSLQQSHFCLPAPCYTDYGFSGLEAMAIGIPTYPFDDSQLGCLVAEYFPEHKDYFVLRSPQNEKLSEKILKAMSNIEIAFESAKKLKKDFVESAVINKSCSTFASLLTPKRTLTESGQSDGHGDTLKPADSLPDTTIRVEVKLNENCYQQHIQKVIQNDTNGARRQTMDTAWRECKELSDEKVREMASDDVTKNRVQKTCTKKFGDGVEVTDMVTKSLEIAVAIPRLVNLYRVEASCQSKSFPEALEPIIITDEMRAKAGKAGIPLKLIATYNQTKFDEIEVFFLNKDGGGIKPAEIFDGVIEEDCIKDMKAESPSLSLTKAVKDNLTDTEQIVPLQSAKTNTISTPQLQRQLIENQYEEVKHEKSILEKQCADLTLRLESAEKVTFQQLKDVHSLKEKLTEVEPKYVQSLKSDLERKERMILDLQTKLSEYEAKLSSLGMQLQQKSADELQRKEEHPISVAEDTSGWSKFILEGQGPSPGQKFNNPCGLTFQGDRLLVCDKSNNMVQILNQNYTCKKVLGSFSGRFAKPFKPQSVAVSKDNHYFILDDNNLQIVVCDENNTINGIITLPTDTVPWCIAVLKEFVLVTDVRGHRLLKYTKTGQYVAQLGGLGRGQTQFNKPYFVAVNSRDVIMVSDCDNHCIKCFDAEFNYLYKYGQHGEDDGQLRLPHSIAVDDADNVYVCDRDNARISMWSSDRTWRRHLFQGEMSWPRYMAVSRDRICVRGRIDKHITVFSK